MTSDQIVGIAAGVLIILIAGGVGSIILMFRQVGELKTALEHLTKAIAALNENHKEAQEIARDENRILHNRIDLLKRAGC